MYRMIVQDLKISLRVVWVDVVLILLVVKLLLNHTCIKIERNVNAIVNMLVLGIRFVLRVIKNTYLGLIAGLREHLIIN